MTTPNFKNSQLGITVSTDHPSFAVGSSGILFTDGSRQLTAFTGTALTNETDPIFTGSVAYNITSIQTGQWSQAYSWGDHSTLYATTGELSSVSGYLQSQIDAAPGITGVVEDTTPKLGGNLDTNNKNIVFTSGSTQYANIGLTASDLHINVDDANAESAADRVQFNIDGTQVLSMTSPGGLDTTFLAQQVDINTNGTNRTIFGYSLNWFNQLNNDIDFRVDGDSNDYVLFVDASEDSVGVGTNSPAYKLDVAGSGSFDALNINDSYTFPTGDGTAGQALVTDGAGNIIFSGVAGGGGGTDTFVTGASFSDTNGVSEITLSLNSGSDITVNMNTVPVVETGSIGQPFHPGTGLGHIDRASYIPVIYQSAFGSVNSYPPILKQSDIYQRTNGSQDLISINPLEKDIDFELGGISYGLFATCAHTNSVVIGQGASASSASIYASYGKDIALADTTYIFSGHLTTLSVGGNYDAAPRYTFPGSDGSAGQALVTDGSGSITFSDAHPNISAASSVNNSGGGFIQDITVDSNGHVTGMTSATAVISDTGLAGSAASLSGILNIVTISSGDYAGLSSKNANTLYFVL